MKNNLIQIVVTFHAGMVAIGYEWGTYKQTRTDMSTSSPLHVSILVVIEELSSLIQSEFRPPSLITLCYFPPSHSLSLSLSLSSSLSLSRSLSVSHSHSLC